MIETLMESGKVKLANCELTRVVLRHDPMSFHPYIVHWEVFPEERPSFYITGGYHEDFEAAVRDFGERALADFRRKQAQNAHEMAA